VEKLFDLLKEKLHHEQVLLEHESLDIFQFPIFADGQQIDFAFLEKNTSHPPHIHEEGSANLYVITGEGSIILGKEKCDYKPANYFFVPKGTAHGFEVREDTILLSIQDKPILHDGKLDFKYAKK
jgi:quercetin dioxygenase-like cupin family protein